jgi:hypothetical protein
MLVSYRSDVHLTAQSRAATISGCPVLEKEKLSERV